MKISENLKIFVGSSGNLVRPCASTTSIVETLRVTLDKAPYATKTRFNRSGEYATLSIATISDYIQSYRLLIASHRSLDILPSEQLNSGIFWNFDDLLFLID